MQMKQPKVSLMTAVIIIIYSVGFYGLNHPDWQPLFKSLIPVNILLATACLAWYHTAYNKSFLRWAVIIYFAGLALEIAGVQTALIFGNYSYGSSLGLSIAGVPLIIGINWLMLVYMVGQATKTVKVNNYVKAFLGSAIMVFTDFFIEPMAVSLDMWSWAGDSIPLYNYISWFFIAFFMLLYFHIASFKGKNRIALPLFLVQLVFYMAFYFTD
jgi:uncharacterized membrane protein